MLRKCLSRCGFGRGKREAGDEHRQCAGEQGRYGDPSLKRGGRHRGVVAVPASRHLVQAGGERERANHRAHRHRLAPSHIRRSGTSRDEHDARNHNDKRTETGDEREQIVCRAHLAVAPVERLGNFDILPHPGWCVARNHHFGANRRSADADVLAFERVAAIDAAARLPRFVRRGDEPPTLRPIVDPTAERQLGESLPRISGNRGSPIRLGKRSGKSDDAAVRREVNARLARIARDERANRPGKRCYVPPANERLEGVSAAARQLDECAKRVIPLKVNGRPSASRREVVRPKERVGPRTSDIARE